jgi:DNA-binding NarL/FixJ family response regulator
MLKGCDKACCNACYKLIIIDILMAEKDGFETSKEILYIQKNVKDIAISNDKSIIYDKNNQICEIIALT